MQKPSFGARESREDYRTVIATDKASGVSLPMHSKIDIEKPSTNDFCNQRNIGICVSCAVRTASEVHFKDGVRLSENWLALMLEVLIEEDRFKFDEGSAILYGLKCANKYGIPEMAMERKYPLRTDGSWEEFVNHFKVIYGGMIPQEILDNASKHKIEGYKSVPVTPHAIATQISEGKLILARFTVGDNTYLPNWKDLFPLREPKRIDGGHAWDINEYYGLDEAQMCVLVNSWSRAWGNNGYGSFIFRTQKPYFTEAWIIEKVSPKIIKEIKKLPVPAYPTWWEKFLAIIKKDNLIEWNEGLKKWVYKKK